jgi:hypothetical protein
LGFHISLLDFFYLKALCDTKFNYKKITRQRWPQTGPPLARISFYMKSRP